MLPIHRAAQYATIDIIKIIHEAYTDGVRTEDAEGLLPMHYAAQRDKSRTDNVEVVQYLLSLNPEGEVVNSNNLDFDDEEDDEEDDQEEDDDGPNAFQNKAQPRRQKRRSSVSAVPDGQKLSATTLATMGKSLIARFLNRGGET